MAVPVTGILAFLGDVRVGAEFGAIVPGVNEHGTFNSEFGDEDLLCQTQLAEQPDAVIVEIELIPFKAVARGCGIGVMIVVPPFASGHQGHPPQIARVIAGGKTPRAPHVGC
jgi:hypothetical protein